MGRDRQADQGNCIRSEPFLRAGNGVQTPQLELRFVAVRAVFILLALAAVAVGFLLPTPGAETAAADKSPQIATLDLG